LTNKWLAGVLRPTRHRPEQRYRLGVVIADTRPEERLEDAQFLQSSLHRCRCMALPMSSWRIGGCFLPLLIRCLRQARFTRSVAKAGCSRSATSQATTLRLQTSIISIEVEPDSAHCGEQRGDVPTPHLVCSCGPEPWNGARFLWWPCMTATVILAVGMKYPVKASLGPDVQPLFGKSSHDLTWRQ